MLMQIYQAAERLREAREEYVRLATDEHVSHYYAGVHALKLKAQKELLEQLRRELDALIAEVEPMERTVIFRKLYAPWRKKAVV